MFKKAVSLGFAVAVAVVFTANVVSADDAVVPVTAPVGKAVSVAPGDCGCRNAIVHRHFGFHRVPCIAVVPVVPSEGCGTPLAPVFAYRQGLCGGYRPTIVWVEKACDCEGSCDCNNLGEIEGCVDFEPFDAYKKTLFGFRPFTAWKKVPAGTAEEK